MRKKLANRRINRTLKITWPQASGRVSSVIVTIGIDRRGRVKEMFCADFKTGSDHFGIITDACILFSRLLQHGDTPKQLLDSMCIPPSLIGCLAQAAADEQNRIDAEREP